MSFRKLLLAGVITTFFCSCPYASFKTENYTDEDSSVRVTSGKFKPCSTVYTPKRDTNGNAGEMFASDTIIKALCYSSKGTCDAIIFNDKDCGGSAVGEAKLDLKTNTVIEVKSYDTSRYVFEIKNGGTLLTLKYPN